MTATIDGITVRRLHSNIPRDLDREWGGSNIRLRFTVGPTEEKFIFINKEFLAVHSPKFNKIFSSDSEEKCGAEIKLNSNYKVFLNIMRILLYIEPENFPEYMTPLAEVFHVADENDFPIIRHYCKQQYEQLDPAEQQLYLDQINSEQPRDNLLAKMDSDALAKYILNCPSENKFTVQDLQAIANKFIPAVECRQRKKILNEKNLCDCGRPSSEKQCQSCTETKTDDFKNKWHNSDIILKTTEHNGLSILIYANKAILMTFSPYFRQKLNSSISLDGTLDISFSAEVMTLVLDILHHNKKLSEVVQKEELYKAADNFEIYFIWRFCISALLNKLTPQLHFQTAHAIQMHDEMSKKLSKLTFKELSESLENMKNEMWTTDDVSKIMIIADQEGFQRAIMQRLRR